MSFPDYEAFWTGRYREAGDNYLFGTAPNRFLASQSGRFSAGDSVLSIADGEGRNAVWLAELGCRTSATEISAVALEKAQRLAQERQVSVDFIQADVFHWAWPDAAFDAVIGIFIQFAGPDERAGLIAGMKKAVRPGGIVLLQGYTPKQLEFRTGGPSAVENLYTADLLRDLFADWEIEWLCEHEDTICEGSAHVGRSALIDLVARKPKGR